MVRLTQKGRQSSFRLGAQAFLRVERHWQGGMGKTYESDDPLRWTTIPVDQIDAIDEMCRVLGATWVSQGFTYHVLARRSALTTVADAIRQGGAVWGLLTNRRFLTLANHMPSAGRVREMNDVWVRMVNSLMCAHMVAERFHGARCYDHTSAKEIVLNKSWGDYTGGGWAFDIFGVDTPELSPYLQFIPAAHYQPRRA